jgi:hypothetical protein
MAWWRSWAAAPEGRTTGDSQEKAHRPSASQHRFSALTLLHFYWMQLVDNDQLFYEMYDA